MFLKHSLDDITVRTTNLVLQLHAFQAGGSEGDCQGQCQGPLGAPVPPACLWSRPGEARGITSGPVPVGPRSSVSCDSELLSEVAFLKNLSVRKVLS